MTTTGRRRWARQGGSAAARALVVVAILVVGTTTADPAAAMTCPSAGPGQIRVGVVVDQGAGAVGVTCVVLPEGSDGLDALHARAEALGRPRPRLDGSGLLCAIDGTPAEPACGSPSGGGFAYWSYWVGTDSGWTYSNRGPAFRTLRDGAVEGWRYLDTGEGAGSERAPRVPVSAGRPPAAPPPTTAAPRPPQGAGGASPQPPSPQPPGPSPSPGARPGQPTVREAPSTAPAVTTTTPSSTTAPAPTTSAAGNDGSSTTTTEPLAPVVDERATPTAQVEQDRGAGSPAGAIAGGALIAGLGAMGWVLQRRRARAWSERAPGGS